MQVTRVSVLQKSQIIFGSGITQGSLFQELRSLVTPSTRIVVITDENVYKHHGSAFLAQFTGYFDQSPLVLSVKPGEISKCYETKEYLERKILQAQCTRDTLVIALGGGVVGDLAGFVAATYMRGISFIQVPTTLLAMVDSSIGGKTGINTPEGKNLVGAFWQPKRIFIDPIFLDSLPIREIRNGLAECIKMFAIGDAEMFSKLEDERVNFENSQYKELLQQVILRSAEMKADIVTRDERESGVRSLLNFGHTIGHAIEGILSDVLLHGECISIGMIKEAEIARALGHLTSADVARLKKCCQIHGLPVSMPPRLSIDDLMEKMTVDKKNTAGGDKRCVLLQSIGKPIEQQATIVADDLIRLVLSRSIAVAPENPPAPISGKIRVPGSKSISNRVLLLAALGSGVCRITGLLHSDDTKVMMNAITSLGIASFSWEENGNILVVHGGGGHCIRRTKIADESTCSRGNPVPVYLGNAGTASRFLTTVCTMIHSGDSQVAQTMLQGNHRMYVRPVSDLVNALRENGCSIEYQGKEGCLPLLIEGTGLPGGELTLNASISSQYVSSILMCAPYAHNEVTLHIAKGKAISQSYIDMTVSLMRLFGIQVEKHSPSENQLYYKIQRGVYQNPAHFLVEADASSSTYPLAIAAITGGTVTAEAIGCHSLQGDSAFCGLLEKMGCTVEQTEIETTVSRCDRPLKGIDVDMEPLTDAFMTAAVVAAVCHQEGQRITRITGIANQRVKECNRIAAMVTELGKCGVTASELPDGIEIHGRPLHEIHGAVIDCHDDHRIAMSFGVLGCVVPGIIIDDKDCVSKTYAEFWEDLYRVFGVRFDTANASTDVASPPVPETDYPVVIVIGMRGAGKSTQCKIAGEYLNMEVIDLDMKFEEQLGNIKLFIQENGWESFRAKEAEIFEGVLEGIATSHHKGYAGAIISCGGGIVETASCRALLKQQRIVIHFRRCIDEIVEYLSTEQERPSYGEEIRKVWDRRAPLYEESSRFEFLCAKSQRDGNPSWSIISRQFCQFVERLLSDGYLHRDFQLVPAPLSRRICDDYPSYFLCLTYSNIEESLGDIRTVTEGVSAVELRVDQLESHTPLFVAHQISLLRCYCNLPVIFTVRSVSQGGRFEYSPSNESNLWELYEIAIRMGIEYIDVEQQWSKSLKSKIFQLVDNVRVRGKRTTQVIVSEHCYTLGILSNHVHHIIRLCEEQGLADIVKVVIRAQTVDDTIMLRSVAAKYSQTKNAKPLISLAITEQGKLSRVFNKFLCPVTHPLLPVPAAPGQLSVHEINLTRSLIGLDYFPTSANQFYLFGSAAIRASPSPAMHNAAFKHLNIPYQYSLFPCESAEEILRCLEKETTKGGNVTMPHKLSVIPHLSSMTPAAKKIGAVNTIVKLSCGKLHGDNTDWLGIANPIIHMANENSSPLRNAIVLGAGGTSRAAIYALRFAVGVENIFIWNPRTLEKAQTIADCFGISAVSNISELSGTKFDVVVSTLPPIAVTEAVENAVSAFVNPNETIVLDVVYFPTDTPILRVAANNNCHAISGSKMLLEQGVYGFEQWTNVRAPYNTMNLAIQTHLSTFQ